MIRPLCIAGVVAGFALCDAWGFALTTIIAAVVAFAISHAAAKRRTQ